MVLEPPVHGAQWYHVLLALAHYVCHASGTRLGNSVHGYLIPSGHNCLSASAKRTDGPSAHRNPEQQRHVRLQPSGRCTMPIASRSSLISKVHADPTSVSSLCQSALNKQKRPVHPLPGRSQKHRAGMLFPLSATGTRRVSFEVGLLRNHRGVSQESRDASLAETSGGLFSVVQPRAQLQNA